MSKQNITQLGNQCFFVLGQRRNSTNPSSVNKCIHESLQTSSLARQQAQQRRPVYSIQEWPCASIRYSSNIPAEPPSVPSNPEICQEMMPCSCCLDSLCGTVKKIKNKKNNRSIFIFFLKRRISMRSSVLNITEVITSFFFS